MADGIFRPKPLNLLNDALAVDQAQRLNQQQIQGQNQQQFKNNMTKLKFLFDSGMKAEGFGFAQGFLGEAMNIDFNKFANSQEDTQNKVASILSKSADTIFDDKVDDVGTASHLDNSEFALKMLSEQSSPVGGTQQQDPPGGVSTSPDVTGLAEQIRAEAPQPQAPVQGQQQVQQPQQPQQAQITPQQQVQQLRERSFKLNSIKGQGTPEQNLQIEAELKQNEGIISDLTRQIPQAGGESQTFAKINPKDFLSSSIKEFQKQGGTDFSLLVPTPKSLDDKVKGLDRFKAEDVLRKEFLNQSKDFAKVRDSFQRVVASSENPSAAGDLALIFNFMKILDPGSVVRESEFANAATAQEFMERKGLSFEAVARVWAGERLSEVARKDFVGRARLLNSKQEGQHKKRESGFRSIAKRRRLDDRNVIVDLGSFETNETSSGNRFTVKETP